MTEKIKKEPFIPTYEEVYSFFQREGIIGFNEENELDEKQKGDAKDIEAEIERLIFSEEGVSGIPDLVKQLEEAGFDKNVIYREKTKHLLISMFGLQKPEKEKGVVAKLRHNTALILFAGRLRAIFGFLG